MLGDGVGEKTGRNTANTKKLIIFAWLMLRQGGVWCDALGEGNMLILWPFFKSNGIIIL